jgi:membrane-bound lytic murein transglycosylase D
VQPGFCKEKDSMKIVMRIALLSILAAVVIVLGPGPTAGPAAGEEAVKKKVAAAAPGGDVQKPETSNTKPAAAEKTAEAKVEASNEDDDGDEKDEGQELMEDALSILAESDEAWKKGDVESALDLLDQAYSLVLDANGDPNVSRQKDDLRLIISKRILAIYNSIHTAAPGKRGEIPLEMNADVEYEIRQFQTRERDFFISAYHRSGLHRPSIVKALKQAGLPEELSWLPLVESGFKVTAYSPARALGIWQFIPSTGYKYGMTRDEWIDERMNIEKSTQAAIGYMKDLHEMFGDWLTVLAAYNCGEGRVMRVMSHQHVNYLDHFWDLYRQLPRETARYVPRFLATLHIIRDPKKYGMDLGQPMEKPMDYEKIKTNKPMKLADIASNINVSEELLCQLNSELRYKATPDREYDLKVPLEAGERLVAVMDDIPRFEQPRYVMTTRRGVVRHRVRRGETLTSIANRYRTSVAAIRDYNRISTAKGLYAGQRLIVPVRGRVERRYAATEASTKRANVRAKHTGGTPATYRIQKGDTLIMLARRFHTTIPELKKLNGMKNNLLIPGRVIKVGAAQAASAEDDSQPAVKKKPVPKKKVVKKKVAVKKTAED